MKRKVIISIFSIILMFTIMLGLTSTNSTNLEKTKNNELAIIDINSIEFKEDFEKVLEEDLGPDYKNIIAKNATSASLANEIMNEYYSEDTNKVEYPNYIGGLYINDNDELVIQIKGNTMTKEKLKSISPYNKVSSFKDENYVIKNVDYSYNELEEIYNRVIDYMLGDEIYGNITLSYIDVRNNRVFIELEENTTGIQQEIIKNVAKSNAVAFGQGSGTQTTAYNTGQSISGCTLGFRAQMPNGTKGFVTAGHCSPGGINSNYLSYGTIKAKSISGSVDAMFVATDTTVNRTLQKAVFPVTQLATGGYAGLVTTGTKVGQVGASTNGQSCQILHTNVTVDTEYETTLTKMFETTCISEKGDSGGPIFSLSNSTIIGIVHGKDEGNGNKCVASYYTNVRSALNVNIY